MKKQMLILALGALATLGSCGGAADAPFDTSKNIAILVRETGSGTKGAFQEILGLKGKADPANAITASSTAAILQEVGGNPYAIGYDSLGYVNDTVKKVNVDGVAATSTTIKDGTYALSRPLNVIYKEAAVTGNALYTDYLAFLGSKEVEEMAATEGYVAIHDSEAVYTKTADYNNGKITISGSTSLQPLMIKIAAKYMTYHPEVKVEVSGGGSGTGYSNAEAGVSALGMISEEFNSAKAASCTPYTVCKDGIALIVNLKNPIENITKQDLSTLYNPDAETPITKWSELIGE